MNRWEQLVEAGELHELTCDGCNIHTELYKDGGNYCMNCLIDTPAEENESLTLEERNR